MKKHQILFLLTILTISCSKSEKNGLLSHRNFEEGNWLLVNVNYAEKTLRMIDDETILANNRNGIDVSADGECGGTTCDGFLMLYKDGKLITQKEYLSQSTLSESAEIIKAYEAGEQFYIDPIDKIDFEKKWDSLKKRNDYPTIYHTQPEDKDIILGYKKKAIVLVNQKVNFK